MERAASAAKKFNEARKTWNVCELEKKECPQEWSNNFDGKWLGLDNEGKNQQYGDGMLTVLIFRRTSVGAAPGQNWCSHDSKESKRG